MHDLRAPSPQLWPHFHKPGCSSQCPEASVFPENAGRVTWKLQVNSRVEELGGKMGFCKHSFGIQVRDMGRLFLPSAVSKPGQVTVPLLPSEDL